MNLTVLHVDEFKNDDGEPYLRKSTNFPNKEKVNFYLVFKNILTRCLESRELKNIAATKCPAGFPAQTFNFVHYAKNFSISKRKMFGLDLFWVKTTWKKFNEKIDGFKLFQCNKNEVLKVFFQGIFQKKKRD